jgi:hypothetical protein
MPPPPTSFSRCGHTLHHCREGSQLSGERRVMARPPVGRLELEHPAEADLVEDPAIKRRSPRPSGHVHRELAGYGAARLPGTRGQPGRRGYLRGCEHRHRPLRGLAYYRPGLRAADPQLVRPTGSRPMALLFAGIVMHPSASGRNHLWERAPNYCSDGLHATLRLFDEQGVVDRATELSWTKGVMRRRRSPTSRRRRE